MGKPLVVMLGDLELPLQLDRVERSDLYGYIDVETVDDQGRVCQLATLASDGRTIIGTSGTAMAMLSPEGLWVERKSLTPIDNQGCVLTPVPSSYSAPVPLTKSASIDEYLSHNIRSVYRVSSDADLGPLLARLNAGEILQMPYSFRGGLEPDAGFLLLAADGTLVLAIGTPTKLEMVGLQQVATADDSEAEHDGDDDLDFAMM